MNPTPEGSKAPAPYRLREDLIFVEQREPGSAHVVIKDPRSGKLFSVNEASFRVLKALDGKMSPEAIASQLGVRGARDHAASKIARLVESAVDWGLLEGDGRESLPRWEAPRPTAKTRLRDFLRRCNPLYTRIPIANPTPLLNALRPIFFPMYSRRALFVFGLSVLATCFLLLQNPRYTLNSYIMFRFFDSWVLLYVALALTSALHEVSHGMACMRFGGAVREVGILIYFFRFCLYTDVSDAWLMPSRVKRIVVGLAGVYAEAYGVFLCIVLWRLAPPFSPLSQMGFVFANVSAARILVNLIPFLRLDGYFVLSDLLGIRNLRPRAFAYIWSLVPRLGRGWRTERRLSIRERFVFSVYGGTSVVAIIAGIASSAVGGYRLAVARSAHGVAIFVAAAIVLGALSAIALVDSMLAQRALVAGRPRRGLFTR